MDADASNENGAVSVVLALGGWLGDRLKASGIAVRDPESPRRVSWSVKWHHGATTRASGSPKRVFQSINNPFRRKPL